jgi:hypothetical protein
MPLVIQDEIDRMGRLKSSAQIIVDYVKAMSPDSELKCYTEWTLEPDNWITIRFAYIRTKTITLTLGVPIESLPNTTGIKVDSRRQWARIYVKRLHDMPAVMQCLRHAYFSASNRYRKRAGFPKDDKKQG